MKQRYNKWLATMLIFSITNLSFGPSVQAFWGQNFWQNLSANVFSIGEDALPTGLFFEWEKSFPQNSAAIAFQNSEGLLNTFEALKESLSASVEEIGGTEEGALLGFLAIAYLQMLEEVGQNLEKIGSVEVFFQYDLEKLNSFSEFYSTSLESADELEALAELGELGICVSFAIEADEEVIDKISEGFESKLADEDVDFSLSKTAESIAMTLGCEAVGVSLLDGLPAEVNLVAYQSGFDYDDFYQAEDSEEAVTGGVEEVVATLDASLGKFYERLREIRSQRVNEDLKAGAFLLSLEPGGHKTQVVASLGDPKNAKMLEQYWSGTMLKTPFFMNEKAGYEPRLLTFSGEDREYVFFEEQFSDLDWTHWYGKIQEVSVSLLPMIAVAGTFGVASLASIGVAEGPDYDIDEIPFVIDASNVLFVEITLSDPYEAPTSADELLDLLWESGGVELPWDEWDEEEICYYYIHSNSQPTEFAFFANTSPISVNGAYKMSEAISKVFAERPLTCETPNIKGATVFNLSQY